MNTPYFNLNNTLVLIIILGLVFLWSIPSTIS